MDWLLAMGYIFPLDYEPIYLHECENFRRIGGLLFVFGVSGWRGV